MYDIPSLQVCVRREEALVVCRAAEGLFTSCLDYVSDCSGQKESRHTGSKVGLWAVQH